MTESIFEDPRPENMTSVEVDEALSKLANRESMTVHQIELIRVLYPDVVAALVEE